MAYWLPGGLISQFVSKLAFVKLAEQSQSVRPSQKRLATALKKTVPYENVLRGAGDAADAVNLTYIHQAPRNALETRIPGHCPEISAAQDHKDLALRYLWYTTTFRGRKGT
jgi:hypothetical protein